MAILVYEHLRVPAPPPSRTTRTPYCGSHVRSAQRALTAHKSTSAGGFFGRERGSWWVPRCPRPLLPRPAPSPSTAVPPLPLVLLAAAPWPPSRPSRRRPPSLSPPAARLTRCLQTHATMRVRAPPSSWQVRAIPPYPPPHDSPASSGRAAAAAAARRTTTPTATRQRRPRPPTAGGARAAAAPAAALVGWIYCARPPGCCRRATGSTGGRGAVPRSSTGYSQLLVARG